MSKSGSSNIEPVIDKVHRYIRELGLICPGERIAVAVSGGADSVALQRVLQELRGELGIVLAVAHFNHRIRGPEADADEQFVRELAGRFDLEFYCESGDAPAWARDHKISLETAARELRHRWFAELLRLGKAEKIATAHTRNDQAETVLMRMIRGAGTRGLAAIAPWQKEKRLVRPLLAITRKEIEEYLGSIRQSWREDQSNRELHHTRNRVRHELLPLLEREYNPAVRQTLADLAEIAQAEEDYWEQQITGIFTRLVRSGKPSRSGRSTRHDLEEMLAIDMAALRALPVAVQRRILRAVAERFGVTLEFRHIHEVLVFIGQNKAMPNKAGRELDLPGGLVIRTSHRELQISPGRNSTEPDAYCYSLTVPGKIDVPELGTTIRAQLVTSGREKTVSEYNSALLLDRTLLAPELTIRNWHAGDRYFPAHTRSPKKVKELLQPGRLGQALSPAERKLWPVIESAGEIVWLRGFPAPEAFTPRSEPAVLIEETTMEAGERSE